MVFDEKLYFLNEELHSQEEIFVFLNEKLKQKDIVKDTFLANVIKREKEFPTGLTIGNVGIAIPHTDAEYVNRSQIAYVSLKEPVDFKEMGTHANSVPVTQVFILALKEAHEQLDMLQNLIELFQNEQSLSALVNVKTKDDFESVIKNGGLVL